jgi:hypothetical protein
MNRIGLNNTKNGLNRTLPTAVNRVGNVAINGAVKTFNEAANGAANTFRVAANEVGEVMANAPAAVNNALGGIPEKIGNVVTNASSGIVNAANNMTNFVSNTTNKILNSVGIGNNNATNNYLNNSAKNNSARNNNAKNNGLTNSAVNYLTNSFGNTNGEETGFFGSVWFFVLIALLTIVGVFIFFFDQILELLPQSLRDGLNRLRAAFGIPVEPPAPAPAPEPVPEPEQPAILPGVPTPAYLPDSGIPQMPDITNIPGISEIMEKQLPRHKKEVFNIKENRYRYEDAEPLCNALGAELATYEQVKEAYERGADWCNYGWVKGQQALYPTQEATYEKLQAGPKDQRQACGKPGINGGYFDNPDLRFGVTCYGVKPGQKEHDKSLLPNGEANPFSPDALEYDKRVAEFKADSQNIGILPFSQGRWDEA